MSSWEGTPSQWEPVSVVEAHAEDDSMGLVEVVWHLSGGATRGWGIQFTPTGSKKGTAGYMNSSPKVVMEGTQVVIRWSVPEQDLEDAAKVVRQSVEDTNDRYWQTLQRQQATAAAQQEEEVEKAQRLESFNQRLNQAGSD